MKSKLIRITRLLVELLLICST